MTPCDLEIEPWLRKVKLFKVLSMVIISENLKAIGKNCRKYHVNKTQTRMDADADTHVGDRKPQ